MSVQSPNTAFSRGSSPQPVDGSQYNAAANAANPNPSLLAAQTSTNHPLYAAAEAPTPTSLNSLDSLSLSLKEKRKKLTAILDEWAAAESKANPDNQKNIETAKARILDVFDEKDIWLVLYQSNLATLPNCFELLPNLEALDLLENKLTELPPSVRTLSKLQGLYLHNNQFKRLPNWLGDLTELTRLAAPHNQLSELPQSIEKLVKLADLDLSNNKFGDAIFNQFSGRKALEGESLELSPLTSLFDHKSKFYEGTNDQRVLILNLQNNKITDVPATYAICHSLYNANIDLKGNPITADNKDFVQNCMGGRHRFTFD